MDKIAIVNFTVQQIPSKFVKSLRNSLKKFPGLSVDSDIEEESRIKWMLRGEKAEEAREYLSNVQLFKKSMVLEKMEQRYLVAEYPFL